MSGGEERPAAQPVIKMGVRSGRDYRSRASRIAAPAPLNSRATTAQPGPGAGEIEHLLHSLNVTDPQLLCRAIALDHATRDLTAEALTKAEQLSRTYHDSKHATGCHIKSRRNRSAQLAAQDLPGAGRTSTPYTAAGHNSPAGITRKSSDSSKQPAL